MEFVWLLLLIGFIALEAATTQFICIWFAGGAFAALISAMFDLNIWWQVSVFVSVSALLLVFTKQFVNRLKTKTPLKTNIDAFMGQTAVVLDEISNPDSVGTIRFRGIEWSARSADGGFIAKGEYVRIKGIDGVKLVVERIPKERKEN